MHTRAYIHEHKHVHVHAHTHTGMHSYTHTHTHTHTTNTHTHKRLLTHAHDSQPFNSLSLSRWRVGLHNVAHSNRLTQVLLI